MSAAQLGVSLAASAAPPRPLVVGHSHVEQSATHLGVSLAAPAAPPRPLVVGHSHLDQRLDSLMLDTPFIGIGLEDSAVPPSALVVDHGDATQDMERLDCLALGAPSDEGPSAASPPSAVVVDSHVDSLAPHIPCSGGSLGGYVVPPTMVVVDEVSSDGGFPLPIDYWRNYESSMAVYR